MRRKMKEN